MAEDVHLKRDDAAVGRVMTAAWWTSSVLPGAPEDYSAVRWIAPLPEMLDPKSEVQAVIQRVRAGFMSRAEAVALTGMDVEELDAEIAADNSRADRYGNVYDSDSRCTTLQGQEQQQQQTP